MKLSDDQVISICFFIFAIAFLCLIGFMHSRNHEIEFRKWQATNTPVYLERTFK